MRYQEYAEFVESVWSPNVPLGTGRTLHAFAMLVSELEEAQESGDLGELGDICWATTALSIALGVGDPRAWAEATPGGEETAAATQKAAALAEIAAYIQKTMQRGQDDPDRRSRAAIALRAIELAVEGMARQSCQVSGGDIISTLRGINRAKLLARYGGERYSLPGDNTRVLD